MNKIMFFVQNLDQEGGAEKYILRLIERIYKTVDLSIIHFGEKNNSIKKFIGKTSVHLIESKKFNIFTFFKVFKVVNREKPDIIHSHLFKSDLFAYFISKVYRVETLSTKYAAFTRSIKKNNWWEIRIIKPLIDKIVEPILSNSTTMVIAVSNFAKKYFQSIGVKSPIVVIEDAHLSSTEKVLNSKKDFYKKYPSSKGKICIGTTSRFVPEKGINYLIDAFNLFHDKNPNSHLFLAGSGYLEPEYRSQILKLGLKKNITFTGYLDKIVPFLSGLDVFVLPSLTDALPLSVQEAMMQKKKIVATDVGGIPELIENGKDGILVPKKSSRKIFEAIELILTKNYFGKNARKKVLTKYTIEVTAQKMIFLYNMVIIDRNRKKDLKYINPKKITNRNYFDIYRNYEDLAEIGEYDPIMREYERTKQILNLIPKGSNVLDVGCNSGEMGRVIMKERNAKVSGIDLASKLVQKAKQRGLNAVVGDAQKRIPFKDNSFDVVVLGELIEHVIDLGGLMNEALRVLKKGGKIVGSTPAEKGRWGKHTLSNHKEHVRCFSRSELKRLFLGYNLNLDVVIPIKFQEEEEIDFYVFATK